MIILKCFAKNHSFHFVAILIEIAFYFKSLLSHASGFFCPMFMQTRITLFPASSELGAVSGADVHFLVDTKDNSCQRHLYVVGLVNM